MASLALTLKEQLKTDRQNVITAFQDDGKPEKLLTHLKANVDAALTQAWRAFGIPDSAALVAVGGYGRGELFPHSDVDVLVLTPDRMTAEDDGPVKRNVEAFIGNCWDAGLEIGSAVRTVQECVA